MFYTIYKITNLLNGKIYIGSHKTKKLDDKYMGSGKYLKAAQMKYGVENFKKEILFIFSTPEDMYAKEAELVNEEFLMTENTYNLKVGGFGGWDYANNDPDNPTHSIDHMKMMSELGCGPRQEKLKQLREDPEWVAWKSAQNQKGQMNRYNALREQGLEFVQPMYGKTHSEEAKRKIGENSSIHQSGQKNSQYGKPRSEQTKQKIKAAFETMSVIQCPHCDVSSKNPTPMKRFHFDNCKKRRDIVVE